VYEISVSPSVFGEDLGPAELVRAAAVRAPEQVAVNRGDGTRRTWGAETVKAVLVLVPGAQLSAAEAQQHRAQNLARVLRAES